MLRTDKKQSKVDIEARRARVGEYLLQRLSYSEMGAMLGVSTGTITQDVKALRKEWARTYADVGAMFERAAMDQDALQKRLIDNLDLLPVEEQAPLFGKVISLMDQRNRLLNLYPKPTGGEESSIPVGPIEVSVQLIDAGNKKLITDEPDS